MLWKRDARACNIQRPIGERQEDSAKKDIAPMAPADWRRRVTWALAINLKRRARGNCAAERKPNK
eukprot:816956-Alexandrium_andersonii.AAC.1